MEELTIEQKAARYDEILARAKGANIPYYKEDIMSKVKEFVDYLLPELKESKESEGERIRELLLDNFKSLHKACPNGFYRDGITYNSVIAWLEKQGEQKPADKVEPKFHEGEWVVYECGEETATLQITRIVGKTYVFSDDSTLGVVDEDTLRLWDITKDAKDGDVLVDGNLPFIFKKIDTNKYSYAYCGISVDDGFRIESEGKLGEWTWMQDIKPATKGQRDLLFKKMKEAGYEWDAENKQLRKIEQKTPIEGEFPYNNPSDTLDGEIENIWGKLSSEGRFTATKEGFREVITHFVNYIKEQYDRELVERKPTWSEEDEHGFENCLHAIKETFKGADNPHRVGTIDWLKFLKERVQPKQEWSKEDEKIYQSIMDDTVQENQLDDKQTNWLRDIKYRNQWKPSDKQIEALDFAADCIVPAEFCFKRKELKGLLEQLKKLRDE